MAIHGVQDGVVAGGTPKRSRVLAPVAGLVVGPLALAALILAVVVPAFAGTPLPPPEGGEHALAEPVPHRSGALPTDNSTPPTTEAPTAPAPEPAPTTTAPTPVAPPTDPVVAPATTDPGPVGIDRADAALRASVAPPWLALVDPPLVSIPGATSLAWYDDNWRGLRSEISEYHLASSWDHLRFVVVHEWAHHVAFDYGSRAYPGAPPAGFPSAGGNQAERWADCAATAITGHSWTPPGHGSCTAEQLQFTTDWFDTNLPTV